MKICKIIAAVCFVAVLSACGAKGTTTSTQSQATTEEATQTEPSTEEPVTAESQYSGETGIELSLPGGAWEVTLDNAKSTRLEQGDKTITASIMDDPDFDTSKLPQSAEAAAEMFSSSDALADVLDYSLTDNGDGTALLSYTLKYNSNGTTITLMTQTAILGEHKAVVVDGIIRSDADDAEIEMMREAISAAMTDKITKADS